MAYKAKNLIKSTSEYVKGYSDIKGVDFSGKSGLKDGRLPYIENMYRDYDRDGELILESVPGYREVFRFENKINGLFLQKVSESEEYILVHAGNKLYRFSVADRDNVTSFPSAIATLSGKRSSAFSHGGRVYILSGEKIVSVNASGKAEELSDSSSLAPYVPCTFKNGEEYEQRNLLTDKFTEKYLASEISELSFGSDGLKYFITDRQAKLCCAVGISEEHTGIVYVPTEVKIGDVSYSVNEISSTAFKGNTAITGVIMNEGLVKVGSAAFSGCTNLQTAVFPDSVRYIGKGAFSGCSKLTELYLGAELSEIGEGAFAGCEALVKVHFSADTDDFEVIPGAEELSEKLIAPSRYLPIKIKIPVLTGASAVSSLTVGGDAVSFEAKQKDGKVTSLIAELPDRYLLPGAEICVSGTFSGERLSESAYGEDFCKIAKGKTNIIKKCTKAAVFDGRIFLYGQPDFPNTVFFSTNTAEGELYFGSLDFFSDGTAEYPIVSVLGAQDALAIMKKADDGFGSIFYHTPKEGKSEVRAKIYPTDFAHRGVCAEGDSAIFFDDPVFISDRGVCALEGRTSTAAREVACRSHNVNAKLLAEDLSKVRFAVWQGYLAVAAANRIYLADSRQMFTHKTGDREYEWFFMNGVGDEKYASKVFKFHSIPYTGLLLHENKDETVPIDYAITYRKSNGSIPCDYVYLAAKDKKKYHVYPTEERLIDDISPISEMVAADDLLFFGCDNGTVCVFNNDKRSCPPQRLTKNDESFDSKEYSQRMDRRLHPDFYHFNNVRARYAIRTGMDDCDIPYLAKNTVSGSIAIKVRTHPSSTIKLRCLSDSKEAGEALTGSSSFLSFHDLSFKNFSFNTLDEQIIVLKQGNKRWTEQEISVVSDEFRSPIGIYSIYYRFKVNGRIKS